MKLSTTAATRGIGLMALVAALAGCGGGSGSTPADTTSHSARVTSSTTTSLSAGTVVSSQSKVQPVVTAVDRICISYQSQINSVDTPSFSPTTVTQGQLPAVARYLAKIAPLARSEATAVSARLADQDKHYRGTAQAFVAVARDEAQELAAAKIGDLQSYDKAIANWETDSHTLGSNTVADGFGICDAD